MKPGPGGEEAVTKSYVYGFDVGAYDRTKPLVLDPAVLVYCGYIDGSGYDYGHGIAIDSSRNAYVTGQTESTEATFLVIGGPDLTHNGGDYDTFVAKISSIQKDDFLGTWDGQGVYYRNSDTGGWVKMASPATLITAGDLGGDGVDDLIGIWPTQGGVWVKSSTNGAWTKLSSSARDMAAGKMRAGTGGSMPAQALFGPMGGYAQGPESLIQYQDISTEGPGGLHFVYQTEEQLIPQEHESEMMRIPGPGEPGFRWVEEKNLIPEESRESDATKEDRERNTK